MYIYYLINCAALILGYFFTKEKNSETVLIGPEILTGRAYFTVFLFIIGVILIIKGCACSLKNEIFNARFSWMLYESYSEFLFNLGMYFSSFVALTLFYCYSNIKSNKFISIFIGIILLILTLVFKNRMFFIFAISGFLGALYYRFGKNLILNKSLIKRLTYVFLFLFFWQIIRATDYSHDQIDLSVQNFVIEVRNFLVHGDLLYFYSSSIEAINQFFYNDRLIFLGVIRRALFFFIPNEYSIGLKPEDLSATFSDWINQGDEIRRGNMPPGFIGIFVLSFGFFSTIPLFLFPKFLNMLDTFCKKNNNFFSHVLISLAFFSTLYLLRGDDTSFYYFTFFQFIVISIITVIFKKSYP